ncbi:MAG: hypothetical protein ACRD04_05165 [Terriglobales bacterium]
MKADLDQLVDGVLGDYSRVEPRPGAVETWMARRAQASARERFLWLPAPAWAVIALALLLLLGLSLLRPGILHPPQPQLANEHMTIGAVTQPKLTAQQQELIHLLLTNPKALAMLKPGALPPPAKSGKPAHPNPPH